MSEGSLLRVGAQAPDFKCMSVQPDGSFKEVSLSDFKGKVRQTAKVFAACAVPPLRQTAPAFE